MTPAEYRAACQRTRNGDLSLRDQRLNAALGLGESGELQNIIKKEVFHGHQTVGGDVLHEAGDILYYLDWLLDAYGWTIENAMKANVVKLAKRYPDGFSTERSINRTVDS
jgi:hypothetical protein